MTTMHELAPWSGGRGLAPIGRDPFLSFRREMDRLFDGFFGRNGEAHMTQAGVWPSVDVAETEKDFRVAAELPGLDPKDVEIVLRDNVLAISGEKRAEHKEENGGQIYAERTYGRFQRSIPLDAEVDADKVRADFKNGLLTVTIPKNPRAREKTRHIAITTH